jgi:hypothetical protein
VTATVDVAAHVTPCPGLAFVCVCFMKRFILDGGYSSEHRRTTALQHNERVGIQRRHHDADVGRGDAVGCKR